jgi:hypothetical protein
MLTRVTIQMVDGLHIRNGAKKSLALSGVGRGLNWRDEWVS